MQDSYWTSYQKMSIRWSGGDNNYCYLIIPPFAYLLWDKRNKGAQRAQQEDSKDSTGQARTNTDIGPSADGRGKLKDESE